MNGFESLLYDKSQIHYASIVKLDNMAIICPCKLLGQLPALYFFSDKIRKCRILWMAAVLH